MTWYKKAQQVYYEYLGDCISTVDEYDLWDATEMAYLIENSTPCDARQLMSTPFVFDELKTKFKNDPDDFDCGINENIVWLHDLDDDIHYFYKRTVE